MEALKAAIVAALASLAQVEQFVRDDGANYFAEAKANLIAAEQAAGSEQPAAATVYMSADDVTKAVAGAIAAIEAVSAKVDALKPATQPAA
jgi:hypothetical protein